MGKGDAYSDDVVQYSDMPSAHSEPCRPPWWSGGHDPVQNRQKDGPLDVEAEPPGLEEIADHGLKARLLPEVLEDEP